MTEPRVLHFNDCAGVAQALVQAAAQQGFHWDFLPPGQVRPQARATRLAWLPLRARHLQVVSRADVVHVHYATSVPLIRRFPVPRRPYFLHLHGTDIREQWAAPATHDLIQQAIDEAEGVYYTNLDTAEAAQKARVDAQYLPPVLDLASLPTWQPTADGQPTRIVFPSRWAPDKNVDLVLEVARLLRAALPAANLMGIDWGPAARAASDLGVQLVPKMSRQQYLQFLAEADLVVGQATGMVGISELEAMSIGPTLAMPGEVYRYPDGSFPPALCGTPAELVQQLVAAASAPQESSTRLAARTWVANHHVAPPFIAQLQAAYRGAARKGTSAN